MKKIVCLIVFSLLVLTWCDNTPPPEPKNNNIPTQNIENPDIQTDDYELIEQSDNPIVSSIDDKIQSDSMWCGTFQLVWNEMIDNVVLRSIVFKPQLVQAENLNKKTFTTDELSEDSYYLTYWLFTKALKKVIEDWIKEKFNETSSILNLLDWNSAPATDAWYPEWGQKQYVFYTMLKKVFTFDKEFDTLDSAKFDDKYNDIEYFWINYDSFDGLRSQVKVLYYNSEDDFAVILKTNEWEDVILSRWIMEDTFMSSYKKILAKSEEFDWIKYFRDEDYLKVPKLSINVLRMYDEFTNRDFYDILWNRGNIEKAVQTIEFDLDEKWWQIKSEAMMAMTLDAIVDVSFEKPVHRYFYFDKPFMIFLKEENKNLPYFAAQVTDITKFQK